MRVFRSPDAGEDPASPVELNFHHFRIGKWEVNFKNEMTHFFDKMTVHLNSGLLTRPFISLCVTAHLPRKFFPRCVCLDPVFIKEINGANSSFKYLNLILARRQQSTLFKDAAKICCWMWSSKLSLNAFLRFILQLSIQRWDVTFCSCWNLILSLW